MALKPRQAVATWLEQNPGWHTTEEIWKGLVGEGFHRKENQIDSALTNGLKDPSQPQGLVGSGLVERRKIPYGRRGHFYEYRRIPAGGALL